MESRVTGVELATRQSFIVRQRFEMAEIFGFESRNKYEILDESGLAVAFAAENQKSWLGFLFRQFLGHWRSFEISFFTPDRREFLRASHPFRFFFQRLEVSEVGGGSIGTIQQRFAILSKKFDVLGPSGNVVMEVRSPFWRLWTFPFKKQERQVAVVAKKWGGSLTEIFTDKDRFRIEFNDPALSESERRLVVAAAIFIDLQYFESKAD